MKFITFDPCIDENKNFKKLPWRKYSLAPVSGPESEESEDEAGSFSPLDEFSSGISSEDENSEDRRLFSQKSEKPESQPIDSKST